jgi:hypothetical protein
MQIHRIYIGGWFQRTILHLTEIWKFMKFGASEIDFPKEELEKYRQLLKIKDLNWKSGPLDCIEVKTKKGISYRIYEDGLIILEKKFVSLKEDFKTIKTYYDNRLSKTLSYIFSKGAPVPKELANIKTILPYIVTMTGATKDEMEKIFKDSKEKISTIVSTPNEEVQVYRSMGIILINNIEDEKLTQEIIESQIFFREFKSQLERYLMIHRIIWEKIERIKERGKIKGTEIDELRAELSKYQKTITLIGARIDQMDAYVQTRQKITDSEKIAHYLKPLFQFKFEILLDTHSYIKNLWKMTTDYLNSAIEIFNELQAKRTQNTIASLQLITAIGVMAIIVTNMSRETWPKLTSLGAVYIVILLALAWVLNFSISTLYKNRKYSVKGEIEKNIK